MPIKRTRAILITLAVAIYLLNFFVSKSGVRGYPFPNSEFTRFSILLESFGLPHHFAISLAPDGSFLAIISSILLAVSILFWMIEKNILIKAVIGLLLFFIVITIISSLGLISSYIYYTPPLYISPSDIITESIEEGSEYRLYGIVRKDSVKNNINNTSISFVITDFEEDITVTVDGPLPDLFREGELILAYGVLENDRAFRAYVLLARLDESFMPKALIELIDSIGDSKALE